MYATVKSQKAKIVKRASPNLTLCTLNQFPVAKCKNSQRSHSPLTLHDTLYPVSPAYGAVPPLGYDVVVVDDDDRL